MHSHTRSIIIKMLPEEMTNVVAHSPGVSTLVDWDKEVTQG